MFKKSNCSQKVLEKEGQSYKIVSKWSFLVIFPHINQLPWKPNKIKISNSTSSLPLMDSPNGLPKLKVVQSTGFEIIGGGGGGSLNPSPPS